MKTITLTFTTKLPVVTQDVEQLLLDEMRAVETRLEFLDVEVTFQTMTVGEKVNFIRRTNSDQYQILERVD